MSHSSLFRPATAFYATLFALTTMLSTVVAVGAAPLETPLKFAFGAAPAAPDARRVTAQSLYADGTGFGLEAGADLDAPDKPFLFSIKVPDGNYLVTLRFGDAKTASRATVKVESRRLMIQDVQTAPGEFVTRSFVVNVRTDALKSGQKVHLKAREIGVLDWDDKLTLEISGAQPRLSALEIAPAPDVATLYIAGDSTVTDQPDEPWAGWGQMLPRFFDDQIAVSNQAESGETLHSFVSEKRLEKVLDTLKKGDYLFIQFGHNDMKERGDGIGAFTSYSDSLRGMISAARARGATPVLVTSMERRRFDAEGKSTPTLGDYPAAVRRVALETGAKLIDLNAMSAQFYNALGPTNSTKAFVHYPENTFPNQTVALKDDTHFNGYGALQLAKCVVEGIKTSVPTLAKFLRAEVQTTPFDPAHPDAPESYEIPASPIFAAQKPDGN